MTEKGTEGVSKSPLTEGVSKSPLTEGVGKSPLTVAQRELLRRRRELDYWKRNSARLRSRNLLTGLGIGAFVVGMFSYTILSVKQERILEEIDDEARIHIIRGPRTGANS